MWTDVYSSPGFGEDNMLNIRKCCKLLNGVGAGNGFLLFYCHKLTFQFLARREDNDKTMAKEIASAFVEYSRMMKMFLTNFRIHHDAIQ